MPYPNEHAARLKDPKGFDKFYRTEGKETTLPGSGKIKIPKTIDILWGVKERENKQDIVEAQSLRFPVKNWTETEARKWLKDNEVNYIKFEPAKKTESMEKQLVFMMPFFSMTAEEFVGKLSEIDESDDIRVLLNSPGGSVFAGWSAIAALEKMKGNKKVDVMGNASSMAFYFTLFFNEVIAYDVTTFMIHRANGYTESKEEKDFLKGVNDKLREKLEARIDETKLKEIKDVTLDDIFSTDGRLDVFLTAEQAKEIGLVSKIERLETKELNAMKKQYVAFSDMLHGSGYERGSSENHKESKANNKGEFEQTQKTETKMTKDELKAQHPEIYKAIYDEGVKQERDRVESYLVYMDVDPESVKKNIEEGHTPTSKFFAEMNRKAVANQQLNAAQQEAPGVQNPGGGEGNPNPEGQGNGQGNPNNNEKYKAEEQEAFAAAGVEPEKKGE